MSHSNYNIINGLLSAFLMVFKELLHQNNPVILVIGYSELAPLKTKKKKRQKKTLQNC